MHYTVTARLKREFAGEFLGRLNDDTIRKQKPDGEEIVESMQRATVDHDGLVRWSEVCYCPTPLQHERETVYDRYFTELKTEPSTGDFPFDGEPFLDYLTRVAESS